MKRAFVVYYKEHFVFACKEIFEKIALFYP